MSFMAAIQDASLLPRYSSGRPLLRLPPPQQRMFAPSWEEQTRKAADQFSSGQTHSALIFESLFSIWLKVSSRRLSSSEEVSRSRLMLSRISGGFRWRVKK